MGNSYIAMNYKCNHDCICCPLSTYDRLHAPLDYKILKQQILNIAKNNKNLSFTISGGEPTIHENFFELLNLLSRVNADITILSNATSCSDKDFVKRIIDSLTYDYNLSKLHYVTAIHSTDSKVHDKITQVNGSLKETLRGLNNLNDNNIGITIKHIMNKLTCESMPNTFEDLANSFSNNVEFQFCSMDYTGRCKKHIEELFIKFSELQPYLEKTIDLFELNKNNIGRELSIFESPLCMVDPYYWKYFIPHNEILSSYIAPNDESENNISNNVLSQCNTNYENCKNCDVKELCGGVWESAYNIGKNDNEYLRPVKVLKKKY